MNEQLYNRGVIYLLEKVSPRTKNVYHVLVVGDSNKNKVYHLISHREYSALCTLYKTYKKGE